MPLVHAPPSHVETRAERVLLDPHRDPLRESIAPKWSQAALKGA
jgi:hypothetical protein